MHYLAKQVARTQGQASAARPRLQRWFESPANAALLEPVTVEREAQPPAPSPVAALPRATIVESVLRRETERVTSTIEKIVPPAEPRRVHAEERITRPEDPRRAPVNLPDAARPFAVTKKEAKPAAPHIAQAKPEPLPLPRTVIGEQLTRILERTEVLAPPPRDDIPRPPAWRVPPMETPPRPRAEHPLQVAVRAVEGVAPASRVRIDDAAPTIHVTIGRVDVRAVVESEVPQRPAPVPRRPSLSLEEYLKQREGRT